MMDDFYSDRKSDKEDREKFITYARDIIEKYIGNPDEVMISTEWRKYSSAEDFLKSKE